MKSVLCHLILAFLLFTTIILTPACIATGSSSNFSISFLDVGQGDCSLLQVNGKNMLIDAGPYDAGPGIVDWLTKNNISYLDTVISTHPHSDHIGAMPYVLKRVKTGIMIDSGDTHTTPAYEVLLKIIEQKNIPYRTVKEGDTINLDPTIRIDVLSPPDTTTNDLNENSIVLRISSEKNTILMMGDAGKNTEERLLTSGKSLKADILKVGHHGSRHSSGREFIKAVSPEIAIIFVGAGNEYGYPQKDPIRYLSDVGAKIYQTDQDGTITIASTNGKFTVTT